VRAALASHPGVHDVGEDGLFARLGPSAQPRSAGALGRGVPRRLRRRGLASPTRWLRLSAGIRERAAELDQHALAAGCRSWVEHTDEGPDGKRAVERALGGARIVHVLRDGRDVTAAACQAIAASRGGTCRYQDAARVIAQWNRSIAWQERIMGRSGHVCVLFEDWVRAPQTQARRLARACGLADDPPDAAVAVADEPGPAPSERHPLRTLFRPRERHRIERALDLERYGQLAERVRRDASIDVVSLNGRRGATPPTPQAAKLD